MYILLPAISPGFLQPLLVMNIMIWALATTTTFNVAVTVT